DIFLDRFHVIVLGWITDTEPWNTFVGNRVKEIRELTKVEDWRFVPGDVNPADLPSRSCSWFELLQREDPGDFVRPTILPDHPIVRRLINYVHQKLQTGVQTTLSIIYVNVFGFLGVGVSRSFYKSVSRARDIH
ncbi:reverse transcriptase, partial [Caerostris extrusa]